MTEPKQSIADGVNVSAYDESFGANAQRAALKTPILGDAYKSIADSAKGFANADGADELAAAAGNMVANGGSFIAGAAVDAGMFALDPIGWLVGNGLNMLLELVQPLQDALHYVTGDGPSLEHGADNFSQIGEGFVALADDFIETGDKALARWKEDAGNAAREAIGEFSVGIQGLGSASGSVAETLKTWSMVMTVIEEVVKAIITELISWLITLWLPALAASVISFGSSVAAAMTASIAKAASVFAKVTKYLGKLGKLLDEFMQFLVKASEKFATIAKTFREGKIVQKGSKITPVIGRKTAEHTFFKPSRRVSATMAGAMGKSADNALGSGIENRLAAMAGTLPDLGVGVGIKSAGGTAKAGLEEGREVKSDALDGEPDSPRYNRSEIGGDRTTEETRRNLDI